MNAHFFSLKLWREFGCNPARLLAALDDQGHPLLRGFFKFLAFWRIVFAEYALNHFLTRASALAFLLLLTLIPLLVSVSIMFTSMADVPSQTVVKVLGFFLPFAPATLLENINHFFANAQKMRGVGIGVLIIMTVGLFGAFEESLNTIWKVTHARSFFTRLRTFTMAIVYGPLLFFASFEIRKTLRIQELLPAYLLVLDVIPFLLTVLAFSIFIWVVPNTRVRFKYAFTGGLLAGLLFELERQWFTNYITLSIQTRTIYGTFGILPFFLMSLFFGSLFMLFGAQVAYVLQNFKPLLRARKRWERRVSDYKTYFSLRIVLDVAAAFLKHAVPPTLQYFMTKYEMTDTQARGILRSLIQLGYIHAVNEREAYAPAHDFNVVSVKSVLDTIEDQSRRIPDTVHDYTSQFITQLFTELKACAAPALNGRSVADLIAVLDEGEKHFSRVDERL
ncbi:MAG: YhjD/YihY/BrkB family envelope integrity protein [Chitinivibrionales bacterium]|nr:YhjD/YihY/BrkB family envelope integrity protein [Chitinivibrionales bacterium]